MKEARILGGFVAGELIVLMCFVFMSSAVMDD
jgi:hypothetical protein